MLIGNIGHQGLAPKPQSQQGTEGLHQVGVKVDCKSGTQGAKMERYPRCALEARNWFRIEDHDWVLSEGSQCGNGKTR